MKRKRRRKTYRVGIRFNSKSKRTLEMKVNVSSTLLVYLNRFLEYNWWLSDADKAARCECATSCCGWKIAILSEYWHLASGTWHFMLRFTFGISHLEWVRCWWLVNLRYTRCILDTSALTYRNLRTSTKRVIHNHTDALLTPLSSKLKSAPYSFQKCNCRNVIAHVRLIITTRVQSVKLCKASFFEYRIFT